MARRRSVRHEVAGSCAHDTRLCADPESASADSGRADTKTLAASLNLAARVLLTRTATAAPSLWARCRARSTKLFIFGFAARIFAR